MCLSNYHQVETKDDEVFLGWKVFDKIDGELYAIWRPYLYTEDKENQAILNVYNPNAGFHVLTEKDDAERYADRSDLPGRLVVRPVLCRKLLFVGDTDCLPTVTCEFLRILPVYADVSAYRSLADFVREDAAKRESDAINS
jgi:hypothetical protein